MELKNFKDQIIAIGKANGNADMGVATDMFLNNIRDAGATDDQYHYAGADQVDYVALQPHFSDLLDQKSAFIAAWSKELGYRA